MPELTLIAWILLALSGVLVGISKTALPGANTVSVAIFATFLPPKASTGALLLLLMVGDAYAVWIYRKDADWAAIRRLVPTVVGGLVLGAFFLFYADEAVVRRGIGGILVVLVAVALLRRWRPPVPPAAGEEVPTPRWLHLVQTGTYGTLAGFTTMAANAAGPVMSMYLLAAKFPMRKFLGTAAWFFAIINLLKLPFSIGIGLITVPLLWLWLALIPSVLIGAFLGVRLIARIKQEVFDWLIIGLTVIGAVNLLI